VSALPTFTHHPLRVPAVLSVNGAVLVSWFRQEADQRQPRLWLGSVGIALAVSAVLLVGLDFTFPLLAVCAWWWCVRMPLAWLLPLGLGVLTVAWVTVGAGLIAVLPLSAAGLIWASIAAALAVLGVAGRAIAHQRSA
jgi:hypothetical protein